MVDVTALAETAILYAVLNGDENEAYRLLQESTPSELVYLDDAIDIISDMIQQVKEENRKADGRD